MVTHDPIAAGYADRVVFLADGAIVDELARAQRRHRARQDEEPGRLTAMWKVTLKGIWSKKVRFLLTGIAVMLGVAFVSGTFVLTATISNTFDGLFSDIYQHTDAVVRAKETFSGRASAPGRGTISADLLPDGPGRRGRRRRPTARCRASRSSSTRRATRSGSNGQGAPTFGFAYIPDRDLSTIHVVEGRGPRTPHEVVIDKKSADDAGYKVGDTVPVVTKAGRNDYTLTGIVKFGTADSPLGATIAAFAPGHRVQGARHPGAVRLDRREGRPRRLAGPGGRQHPHRAQGRARHRERRGDQRQGHHQGESEQPEGQPLVLQHVPAHLRSGRAARRLVHHLQHLLDHRRAAQPRARAAARHRRRAAPGARLRAVRGGAGRPGRVDRRVRRRDLPRRGAQGAARRARARHPRQLDRDPGQRADLVVRDRHDRHRGRGDRSRRCARRASRRSRPCATPASTARARRRAARCSAS